MAINNNWAEASGPFGGFLAVKGKFRLATCCRGNLFLPKKRKWGVAKLRPRDLFRMSCLFSPGKRFAVSWSMSYDLCTRLWEGTVKSILPDGRRLVKYDLVDDRLFLFPPKDERVQILGGRVGFLGKWKSKRNRKRTNCPRSGYRGQGSEKNANRGGFTISALNVDTLKVKATDTFTLRKSIRLYQVAGFMRSQHVDLMALQETRLKLMIRFLFYIGSSFKRHLTSPLPDECNQRVQWHGIFEH